MVGPAVLLSEPVARGLIPMRAALRRHRVPVIQLQATTRAAHYLAVRQTPIVLIVADSPSWAVSAVAVVRQANDAPVVVAGITPTDEQLRELLGAGANLVIDGGANEAALCARIGGFYGAVRRDQRPAVRWLEAEGLRIDLTSRVCVVDGQPVRLSRMEYELLVFLMRRAQQAVPPLEIVTRVWRWNSHDALNTLRIHVGRLRRKLGDDAQAQRFIGSDRAAGYWFQGTVAELSDEPEPAADHRGQALLDARLSSIYAILRASCALDDDAVLGQNVTDAIVGSDHCDAASIFRYDRQHRRSQLVASTGTSPGWAAAMRRGHALEDRFVGPHASHAGRVIQVADITTAAKRYPATATLVKSDQMRSFLVAPIVINGESWGDIGFTKRQPRAFTPQQSLYLQSLADVVALRMAATHA